MDLTQNVEIDSLSADEKRLVGLIREAAKLKFAVLLVKFQDGKAVHADVTKQVKL